MSTMSSEACGDPLSAGMDYFVLCFGRTAFTRATVDAIHACAALPARVHLINNGWNERLVPLALLAEWRRFVDEYLGNGRVASVIERPTAVVGAALDGLTLADERAQGPYYWVTDNDCVVDTPGFDRHALGLMAQYGELSKLGVDFARKVSRTHAESFARHWQGLLHFLPAGGDYRIVPEGAEISYCQETGTAEQHYRGDARITNNLVDTTLSIVRKGRAVAQGRNRVSLGIAGLRLLHIGYLEPVFDSACEASVLEMLHYMNLRPLVLTEWAQVYRDRAQQYLHNLALNGRQATVQDYNRLLSALTARAA